MALPRRQVRVQPRMIDERRNRHKLDLWNPRAAQSKQSRQTRHLRWICMQSQPANLAHGSANFPNSAVALLARPLHFLGHPAAVRNAPCFRLMDPVKDIVTPLEAEPRGSTGLAFQAGAPQNVDSEQRRQHCPKSWAGWRLCFQLS